MEEIIHLLHQGGYSCVIANNEIRTFTQRGIADLYDLLIHDAAFLTGASIADKVIGKAAAALIVIGGIKKVYTDVISSSALTLLRNAKVEVTFGQMVPFIQNRDQTGWCPMEKKCYQKESAESILVLIKEFIENK
jgi:Domain of unknown function (DUF1893).